MNTTRGLKTEGSCNQGFLHPGVFTTKGLTTRGFYKQGS